MTLSNEAAHHALPTYWLDRVLSENARWHRRLPKSIRETQFTSTETPNVET